ncbi:MAG: transposase, partial [Chloroflexi bacterium]|nr:transposase [Chloroflexota bacterium]
MGSARRECIDHVLLLGEAHLRRALREYVTYFNGARPHQGIAQRVPQPRIVSAPSVGARRRSGCDGYHGHHRA